MIADGAYDDCVESYRLGLMNAITTLTRFATPFRVALLGTAIVVFLLLVPVRILAPGDHEMTTCGNALVMDLDRWLGYDMEYYREQAFRRCTDNRLDRLGQAVGVTSVTVLVVTLVATRRRPRVRQPPLGADSG